MLKIRITKLKDLNPYIWINQPNMMNVGYNYLWNNGGSSVIGTGNYSSYTAYRDIFQLSEDGKLDIVGYSRSATNTTWYNNMENNTSTSGVSWTSNASEIMDVQNGIKHLLDDVTSIGNYCLAYVFQDNTTITELPDLSKITSVGSSGLYQTFRGCTGLTGTIPDLSSITSVGSEGLSHTFYGCTKLTGTPKLPNITEIPSSGLSGTFSGCTGLTGTPDLSKITSVGDRGLYNTFSFCTGLTGTPDLSNITTVGTYGFYYTFFGCTGLTGTPKLPNITSIPSSGLYYTFYGCTGLSGTPDLSNLTSLGEYGLQRTFYNCTGLTGTPDLSNLTSVGDYGLSYTFYGCTGLTGNVYFRKLDPTQVTITGTSYSTNPFYQCFYGCTGIDSVHFPASLTATQKSYLTKSVLFGGTTTAYCKSTCDIYFDINAHLTISGVTDILTVQRFNGTTDTYNLNKSTPTAITVSPRDKLVFGETDIGIFDCINIVLSNDGTIQKIAGRTGEGIMKYSDTIYLKTTTAKTTNSYNWYRQVLKVDENRNLSTIGISNTAE